MLNATGANNPGITLPRLVCLRCGYVWVPRKEELPKNCPDCNSPYWGRPRRKPQKGG